MGILVRLRSIWSSLRKHLLRVALVLLALWMIGIRFYNDYKIDASNARISSTIESFSDIRHGQTVADLSMAHHFAVLSAVAYGEDEPWDMEDCDYQAVLSQWTHLEPPASIPTRPNGEDGEQSRWDSPLEYDVWHRELPGSHRQGPDRPDLEVVVAFRGTDDLRDNYSNFRWLTRFLPGWDQYDLARTVAPAIERHIASEFPDRRVRMITAGHSLGGGLAQQAAYAASTIKTVYAFDSTSVTGFYSVDAATRDAAKTNMRIYRVSEKGEVLQYLRSFMSWIYPVVERNPQIVQVTYNADQGNAVGQHNIKKLACALIRANGTDEVHPTGPTAATRIGRVPTAEPSPPGR